MNKTLSIFTMIGFVYGIYLLGGFLKGMHSEEDINKCQTSVSNATALNSEAALKQAINTTCIPAFNQAKAIEKLSR